MYLLYLWTVKSDSEINGRPHFPTQRLSLFFHARYVDAQNVIQELKISNEFSGSELPQRLGAVVGDIGLNPIEYIASVIQ